MADYEVLDTLSGDIEDFTSLSEAKIWVEASLFPKKPIWIQEGKCWSAHTGGLYYIITEVD